MPVLCCPAVSVPEHVITMEETLDLARRTHRDHDQLPLALRLIGNTGVRKRHLVQPIEETLRHPGLERRNLVYVREAQARIPAVVERALRLAEVTAEQVDAIIFVSCTGFTMPSLTAWMINNLGFGWTPGSCRSPSWVARPAVRGSTGPTTSASPIPAPTR
jgi:1,3,6,8-tetrahydroxynaphthalene synthase